MEVIPIKLSEVENLLKQGYETFVGGDAAKANCDGFQIMVKRQEGQDMRVSIVCPTFLRGPLSFRVVGGIAY